MNEQLPDLHAWWIPMLIALWVLIGLLAWVIRLTLRDTERSLKGLVAQTFAAGEQRYAIHGPLSSFPSASDDPILVAQRRVYEPLIEVVGVHWDRRYLYLTLADDRVIGAALERWPSLRSTRAVQRRRWRITGDGSAVVWDALDVYVSARRLLGMEE